MVDIKKTFDNLTEEQKKILSKGIEEANFMIERDDTISVLLSFIYQAGLLKEESEVRGK